MPVSRSALVAAATAMVLSAGLAACDDGSSPAAGGAAPTAAEPRYAGYVALGDSYTAAPGVPSTETSTGCYRSTGNYPTALAAALDVRSFDDASCSGATTSDLTTRQLPELRADTSLVTVGIGGNDLQLFQTLIDTCIQLRSRDPEGSPCADSMATPGGKDLLLQKVHRIGGRVATVLEQVRARSPQATVVLVGYPQPVPARGRCDALLPLAAGDYAYVRSVGAALDAAMERAAAKGGATYVSMLGPSRGHDICAGDDAWVNGSRTDLTRAIAFHPFAAEQQAVTQQVLTALGR